MMLRWIAFDAVGTLIFPQPDVAAAYALVAEKYGSRLSVAEIRLRFRRFFLESAAACLPVDDGHILTSEDLERARWRWIVSRVIDDASDPEACFAELYDHFARPEHWRLFDDVAPTLERLQRRGLRCALASNFDRRLHGICRGRPELQSIERIVVSTDVGVCKPSSRFYSALLDACDCRPDEVLMIGDDDEADVLGPQQLGISAILIDRHGQAAAPNSIRSLTELPFLAGRP